jgi:predicted transcriptional regulator of viral defense system
MPRAITSTGSVSAATQKKARAIFRQHQGLLSTAEALRSGIHPRTLSTLQASGLIERMERGVYRLVEGEAPSDPDLLLVAKKYPKAVLCLISALSFHNLTTQIPHQVWIALKKGTERPRLGHPPLSVVWFSGTAYTEGRETHDVGGISIQVYSPEKTLADTFKFRNRIGIDTCVEALQTYQRRKKKNLDQLVRFAKICRVHQVMQPYLDSFF